LSWGGFWTERYNAKVCTGGGLYRKRSDHRIDVLTFFRGVQGNVTGLSWKKTSLVRNYINSPLATGGKFKAWTGVALRRGPRRSEGGRSRESAQMDQTIARSGLSPWGGMGGEKKIPCLALFFHQRNGASLSGGFSRRGTIERLWLEGRVPCAAKGHRWLRVRT